MTRSSPVKSKIVSQTNLATQQFHAVPVKAHAAVFVGYQASSFSSLYYNLQSIPTIIIKPNVFLFIFTAL